MCSEWNIFFQLLVSKLFRDTENKMNLRVPKILPTDRFGIINFTFGFSNKQVSVTHSLVTSRLDHRNGTAHEKYLVQILQLVQTAVVQAGMCASRAAHTHLFETRCFGCSLLLGPIQGFNFFNPFMTWDQVI